MSDIHAFHLRLSEADPLQREVLDILRGIPKGRRTSEICRMIVATQKEKDLKQLLTETIREAIGQNISRLPVRPQQKPAANPQGEGIREDILSFLDDFQEGGEL
ncbi:MAG TPA: hypothetical protein PKB13_06265 [Clostridia bacterium]|nr:hypothetical protein [Clostridia bacterium]